MSFLQTSTCAERDIKNGFPISKTTSLLLAIYFSCTNADRFRPQRAKPKEYQAAKK
jgi:hypothetical protein